MVKLNFGEIECFYSDVYKKTACRIYYNSPWVVITGAEIPVDMLSYSINEIKSAMNRALQQGNMDLYNKYMQDLNAINQAIASPSPTPPPPVPPVIQIPTGADVYEEIKKAYFPTPAPTETTALVPTTTMVPQKVTIMPVEEFKSQAYVTTPAPTPTPAPTTTQPAAPLPVQPQVQPQVQPTEKKEEEERKIDLKKLALLGIIGYLIAKKK